MREGFKNFLLFIASLTVVLVACEVGLRIYSNYVNIYDIEMYKYAKNLKRKSSFEGVGYEHIPNTSAHLMNVDVKINSLGFRDDELPDVKTENEIRILAVGQSITFGWGVPFEDTFVQQTEARLNAMGGPRRYNIINSGIGNSNSRIEYYALKKNLPLVNPDQIILHMFLRDALFISDEPENFIISSSYLVAFSFLRLQQALIYNSGTFKDIGEYYESLYRDDAKGWLDQKQAILNIKNLAQEHNIPLIAIIQPDLHDLSPSSKLEECYKKVRAFLTASSIEYLDLSLVYRSQVADPHTLWVSSDDPHPNAAGHKIVADELVKYFSLKQGVDKGSNR